MKTNNRPQTTLRWGDKLDPYDIDEATGLPVLPKGCRWKITASKTKANVLIQRNTILGVWVTKISHFVGDDYHGATHPSRINTEELRKEAQSAIRTYNQERVKETYDWLGTYPPKNLNTVKKESN